MDWRIKMLTIAEAAKELKLIHLKENHEDLLLQYTSRGLNLEEALTELLSEEVYRRRDRSSQRQLKEAKFSQRKYLMDFDDQVFKEPVRKTLRELKTLKFIEEKENVILIGNPGTGKTHFSIGLGIEACLQGYSVRFVNAPNLIIELKEVVTQSQFYRFKQRINKVDLLIVDELGYLSFDQAGSELIFNLLSNRITKGSIIITTNLTFDRWQECFKDPTLTGALVDRLAYKAHVVDMRGESYRLKETSQWMNELTEKK